MGSSLGQVVATVIEEARAGGAEETVDLAIPVLSYQGLAVLPPPA